MRLTRSAISDEHSAGAGGRWRPVMNLLFMRLWLLQHQNPYCRARQAGCGSHRGRRTAAHQQPKDAHRLDRGTLAMGISCQGSDCVFLISPYPRGHPEDSLRLKSLPPSEEDNDDAQILPSPVLAFSMDNLSLVCLPPSEDDDWGDDDGDDDVQILPSPVLARPEDGLFLRCSPQCKDEDDDDDDGDVDCDDDDDDVQIRSWKGKDLMLESISDVETHPGLGRGPEDMRLLHRSKRRFSPSLMHTKVPP
ncbi:aspartate-rich protein 1-like isoform X2 [Macaca nemestrina]|uniref:aspartate-rich protein 1-like isoform X2 n=1 Tax=Macaca nemestrina TaxID=9545 RepID=UPI0039B9A6F2